MSVSMLRCACERCSCEVLESQAVVRHGQSFCSDACATGHPNHEPCHGNGACGCTCADWAVQLVSLLDLVREVDWFHLLFSYRLLLHGSLRCVRSRSNGAFDGPWPSSWCLLLGPIDPTDRWSELLHCVGWSVWAHWQIARPPVLPFLSTVTIQESQPIPTDSALAMSSERHSALEMEHLQSALPKWDDVVINPPASGWVNSLLVQRLGLRSMVSPDTVTTMVRPPNRIG